MSAKRTKVINNFFWDGSNDFLCYRIRPEDIAKAKIIFEQDFGSTNLLNSYTVYDREESRIAGILGEVVFQIYLEHMGFENKFVARQGKPYDFIVINGNEEHKIDVKCKFRKVEPKKGFEASFFAYQSFKSDLNMYAFLSTIPSYSHVWFCGIATKDGWEKNPDKILWKRGQTDPSNHKTFHEDTWSVHYGNLTQFSVESYKYSD